jgi:hypothetical protein
MSDDDPSESIKKGSNSVIAGFYHLKEGLNHYVSSLGSWFEQHPWIKNGIMLVVSATVGPVLLRVLTQIQIYLFGAVVPISRDVRVEIFPAPIGFTLWIFSIGFILLSLQAYFRFVSFRQRIEALEKNHDDN